MAKQPETKVKFSIFNKEFNEGIGEMTKESTKLKKEFKLQSEQMKDTATATEKLEAKISQLGKEQGIVKQKIKSTDDQLEKAKKTYGENSNEAGKLENKLLDLKISEQKLENSISQSRTEIDKQGQTMNDARGDADRLKRSLKDVADTADKVGDKMTNVGQTLTAGVTAPIVAFGTLAVESTREMRTELAKLETNAEQAGVGVDVAEGALRDLNAITGETDSNLEAISNLMETGMNGNQLKRAVDDLSGAVIKFPDTLKIEGLADGLQETLATGKAIGPFAELLERMGVDLKTFDKGLGKAKESGGELNYALNELNKLDLSKVNEEFRKTNKELIDAKDAQYDFQMAFAELGAKLEPIATRMTNSVTEVIDAFSDLEPATQDNIIKFAGMAAAVGPLAIGLGSVTKGVSSLTSGLLGDKGLLGGIKGLSKGGIAGLAIGGVAALGLGIYELTKDSERNIEETLKMIETRKKDIDSTSELISSYENLSKKNKLSADEVLRYMDIMGRLKEAKNEETIAKLTKEQAGLLKKSGFTNKEMETFLGLNDKIIKKTPKTSEALGEEKVAFNGVLGELKKINEEKRKRLTKETGMSLISQLVAQRDKLAEQKGLQKDLNEMQQYRKEKLNSIITRQDNLVNLSGNELRVEKKLLDADRGSYNNLLEKIEKKKTSIGKNDKELEQFEKLKSDYAQMVLYESGIVAEKGKAVEAVEQEQKEIDEARKKLQKKYDAEKISTSEYNKQNGKLDTQQGKLNDSIVKLDRINEIAEGTIYKDLNVYVDPSINWLNDKLGEGVNKTVSITESVSRVLSYGPSMLGYGSGKPHFAKGTDYHKGGPAIVGEKGPELVKQGDDLSLQGFGLMPDLSRGAEVFTADQTKKILSGMNKLPGYASGVGVSDAMAANIKVAGGDLASRQENLINRLTVSIEASEVVMDGRAVGSITWKPVKEFIDRGQVKDNRAKGID